MNRTNSKHYKYFRDRVRHWVNLFGLKEWEIYYGHKKLDNALASYEASFEARNADIYLSTDWGNTEITLRQLDKAAFHEVTELLLADLAGWANIIVKHSKMQEEKHKIIRRLENVFFKEGA